MNEAKQPLISRVPAAALAVAVIFLLTAWQPNVLRVPYEDVISTFAVALGIIAVVTWGLRLVCGDWRRAALIGAIWTAYCFYAPSLVSKLVSAPWLRWSGLVVLALFLWDVSRRVPKSDGELSRINRLANLILGSFAAALAAMMVFNQVRLEQHRPDSEAVFPTLPGHADANSPNVWHVLLDRYGSQETLARVYHYDNAPFLEALRRRGFTVSHGSYSNYQRTGHSVPSTLNASYLDPLARSNPLQADWVPLYRSLTDNAAQRFFSQAGYETILAGSWWNPSRHSASASRNVNFYSLPQLGRLVLDESVVGRLMALFNTPLGNGRRDQCLRERAKFVELRKIAAEPGRKYVFAHFLVPHPPYVLNADGSCRSLGEAVAATREENYTGQITFANGEVLALIDAILAGPRPATIILHADEGPWPEPYVGDERFLGTDPVAVDWPRLDRNRMREKMGILLAIRHADGKPSAPLATPVNIYPAVINRSFHGTMPILPDRSYVFNSDTKLYRFTDVTAVLK